MLTAVAVHPVRDEEASDPDDCSSPGKPAPSGEESGRLRALAAYGMAGTGPETDLDHFAALAADLLGQPVGLVNLVGSDEVVVKGRQGIEAERLPRAIAFCDHTVRGDAVLAVPDLAQDARFADNPLVTAENGFRFYAGVPLVSPLGGCRVGTLCIAGPVPRPALDGREIRLLTGLASLVMDRMELRRLEKARRDAQSRFDRMAAASPGAVICAASDGRITHWNAAAEHVFGWTAADAVGRAIEIIVPEPVRGAHAQGLARLAAAGSRAYSGRTMEVPALRRDGSTFLAQLTLSCWDHDGQPAFGATIYDITARRAAEARLRHLAHHDPLTGLANRAQLNEQIAATAAAGKPCALVLLDLDGFKHVNDTLGHGAGDILLTEVSSRFNTALAARGTLARLGGDEFAALLPDCGETASALAVAQAMQDSLKPSFSIAGRSFRVGAGAGVALGSPADARTLLADADLALYQAKSTGKNACRLFSAAMREEYDAQRRLEEEVRLAALDGQFVLHYQPQLRLFDRALVGAEALIRWNHPTRGLLPPSAFLGALEAGPLAGIVGDWAIDEACRQSAAWREQGLALRVGVNLFAEQLRAGGLYATVRAALARWGLPAAALELELTETIALSRDDGLLAPLRALSAEGIGIAFDDFGTGFASLSTLKRCPLTRLKVDRSFVSNIRAVPGAGIAADRGDLAIIEAVLALGRGLNLGVVAEGIETADQAAFLASRGCEEGQGYFFGRPSPAAMIAGHFPAPASHHRPDGPARRLAASVTAWAQTRRGGPAMRRLRRRDRM